ARPTITPSRSARSTGFTAGSRVTAWTIWKTSASGRPGAPPPLPPLRPPGAPADQPLGDRIQEDDGSPLVGCEDGVAEAREGRPQPFALLQERAPPRPP